MLLARPQRLFGFAERRAFVGMCVAFFHGIVLTGNKSLSNLDRLSQFVDSKRRRSAVRHGKIGEWIAPMRWREQVSSSEFASLRAKRRGSASWPFFA
jgi:hypothetical protein